MTPPDWVTLRIFLAAVELGSLSRAAEQCGIAISAAARRVQDLEADCGVPLLERSARGVRPTAAGERLARHASTLLEQAGRLSDDLRAFAGGGSGSVRLSATTSALSGHRLAEDLAAFAAARPGISVELQEETTRPILDALLQGRTDLGIITSGVPLPAGLEAELWHTDRLLVLLPAGHRFARHAQLGFADVLAEPLIGVQAGGALALLLEQEAALLGRALHYRFRVASTDAARRLVAAGHGLTVMPDGVAGPYQTALGLRGVPLAEPWAKRQLRLVSRPSCLLPRAVRLLFDHLNRSADVPP